MQIRRIEYQAPVDSFPLSEARVGIIPPGRYRGFDVMVQGSGAAIAIKIQHTGDNFKPTNSSNTIVTNPWGVAVSKHGTMIAVTDDISLQVDAGDTQDRYDTVYMEYSWVQSSGGSTASFILLKGTPGISYGPTPPNQNIDIILGYVYVPANASTFADLEWIPIAKPLPGDAEIIPNHPELDDRYAVKAEDNIFTGQNQFRGLVSMYYKEISAISYTGDAYGCYLLLGSDANFIKITDSSFSGFRINGFKPSAAQSYQIGTKLIIQFNIPNNANTLLLSDGNDDGFIPFPISSSKVFPDIIRYAEIVEFMYVGDLYSSGAKKDCWIITNMISRVREELIALQNPIFYSPVSYAEFYSGYNWKASTPQAGGYLHSNGLVVLKGMFNAGIDLIGYNSDSLICTLPSAISPTAQPRYFSAYNYSSYASGRKTPVILELKTNGELSVLADASNTFDMSDEDYEGISIDGISFHRS